MISVFKAFKSTLIFMVLAAGSLAVAGETYKVDASHSTIIFSVKHFNASNYYGRFNDFEGQVQLGDDHSSFELSVKAESLDTHHEKRDKHLRGSDFFNAVQFPEVTFKSTSIEKKADGGMTVSGDLTILGKTKQVTFQIVEVGAAKDPWGNYRRGFEGSGVIKRSDFGMNYGLEDGALGDEVRLLISLECIRS